MPCARSRPDIAIGADLIAGFPTETEAMHGNLAIVRDCGVVHGHVFPYSPPRYARRANAAVAPATVRARAAETAVAAERALARIAGRPSARSACERDGTGHSPEFAPYRLPEGGRGHHRHPDADKDHRRMLA
jgi:threonylcarbamoyladenosine tRNA methylthiotransferase MtaB